MPRNQAKRKHSIRYAQNFLMNPALVRRIVRMTDIINTDIVIEIGPGRGIITEALSKAAKKVVAVEKDKYLAKDLQKQFRDYKNVAIVRDDFLSFKIHHKEFKIFANPPFNISTKILRKIVALPHPPSETYLIMQHEAAQRFTSISQEYLFCMQNQPWFKFKTLHSFNPEDFKPSPGVRTVLLAIYKKKKPDLEIAFRKKYQRFVSNILSGPNQTLRKKLQKKLAADQWKSFCRELKLDSETMPMELSSKQWVRLFQICSAHA